MTPIEKEYVSIILSLKEAALIKAIREHKFATIKVFLKDGEPTRIEIESSQVFTDSDGLKLLVDSIKLKRFLDSKNVKIHGK